VALLFGLGLLIVVILGFLGILIFEALGLWPVTGAPAQSPVPGDS
jgi:hypothetical protein